MMYRSMSALAVITVVAGISLQRQPTTLAWSNAPAMPSMKMLADEQLTFEVYKDAKSEFRWRLKAANKQVIGSSGQGYSAKADCTHAIDVIKENAAKAKVEEVKE